MPQTVRVPVPRSCVPQYDSTPPSGWIFSRQFELLAVPAHLWIAESQTFDNRTPFLSFAVRMPVFSPIDQIGTDPQLFGIDVRLFGRVDVLQIAHEDV